MLNGIEKLLKLYLLERAEYPLFILISTSISMLEGILAIVEFVIDVEKKEQCLFATSPTNATIQDEGKRERSDLLYTSLSSKRKRKENSKQKKY